MQPDTAFWVLSTIAQSSAALAGLTALLLVFILSQAAREIEIPLEFGIYELLGRAPSSRLLALGTFFFLFAVIMSLGALAFVVPGETPVITNVETAVFFSLGLVGAGSITLVRFVMTPRKWFESAETREARREARKRRRG